MRILRGILIDKVIINSTFSVVVRFSMLVIHSTLHFIARLIRMPPFKVLLLTNWLFLFFYFMIRCVVFRRPHRSKEVHSIYYYYYFFSRLVVKIQDKTLLLYKYNLNFKLFAFVRTENPAAAPKLNVFMYNNMPCCIL